MLVCNKGEDEIDGYSFAIGFVRDRIFPGVKVNHAQQVLAVPLQTKLKLISLPPFW